MKRGAWANTIGFALLGACFVASIFSLVDRARREAAPGTKTIRVAHWQLESGLRDAFDAVAAAYMAGRPGVVVEQLPVPERVFKSWLRTQLVGGTAPDIIELGQGLDTDMLGRHFIPLTEALEEPNPYNAGTELEGLPWRRTFTDGLASAFNEALLDYYGVPTSMFTVRVLYNKTLWREIFGDRPTPRTYDEFIEVCEAVVKYAEKTGRPILPISSSRYHAKYLTDRMFQSQTQRLMQRLDRARTLAPTALELAMAYLEDEWSYEEPAVRDGFQLLHETGRHMQPGFNQLAREDGTFFFVQGRALMTSSGSWDASSFRAQAPFELGAFPVPLPARDDPRFGANVVGMASEAGTESGALFGVTRESPNADVALDFLRFLTSPRANRLFMEHSGWLPIVVGVNPAQDDSRVAPFMPILEGAVPGISPTMKDVGTDTRRLLDEQFHRLVGPGGGVSEYIDAVGPRMKPALRSDLRRRVQRSRWNLWRQDVAAAAHGRLHELTGEKSSLVRWSLAFEGQFQQEADLLWMERLLEGEAGQAE